MQCASRQPPLAGDANQYFFPSASVGTIAFLCERDKATAYAATCNSECFTFFFYNIADPVITNRLMHALKIVQFIK